MKFLPRSRVIWGGTLVTVFAAEKKMKNARIIQLLLLLREGIYLCGGGYYWEVSVQIVFNLSKRAKTSFPLQIFAFYDDDPCIFVALSWRNFSLGFAFVCVTLCVCDTLSVWHTLWSPLIIHSAPCLFCLGSHLCVHVLQCEVKHFILAKHNTNFTLANTLCNKQIWPKVCFVLPEGCYEHWLLNIMKFVIVCS